MHGIEYSRVCERIVGYQIFPNSTFRTAIDQHFQLNGQASSLSCFGKVKFFMLQTLHEAIVYLVCIHVNVYCCLFVKTYKIQELLGLKFRNLYKKKKSLGKGLFSLLQNM